ncbi:MAG: site-2 protease family protein [Anaerolineae bacterium]|nr:site-2 protease family protein [Anaerolineae bacterium]MDW8098613.1 site-2 protease family protein [Anaerolineae bacterium]
MKSSIRLFRVLGIEVGLDHSWFLVFALLTWMLASQVFPRANWRWTPGFTWTLATLTSLLFFTSVLVHEFSHSLAALATGVPVRRITLFIFGGIAELTREPSRALDEFLIAAAGPLASLILAAGFGVLWLIGHWLEVRSLTALGGWLGGINLSLAAFNLIPGFPLDGGRMFRAVIWGLTGNLARATRLAARLGQGVAYIFIFWGAWRVFRGGWMDGLWLAFIGWFLMSAATQSVQQVALRQLLAGFTARDVMTTDCPAVPPQLTLDVLVDQMIMPTGRRCFPVVEGDNLMGLVTLHRIKEAGRDRWPDTHVRDVMIPREEMVIARPDESLEVIFERMTSDGVNQMPVIDQQGRMIGLVARDHVLSFLRTRAELAA